MAIKKANTEVEIIVPHSSNYIRTVVNNLTNKLKKDAEATVEVPTIFTRAKALVNRDSFIMLFTTKEDE